MRTEIISHIDVTYLVIPQDGIAFKLFLEQLEYLNTLDACVYFMIITKQDIQDRIGPNKFCIEFMGEKGNQVNPFLYQLFQVYINNNLEEFSEN